ncbi:tRNA threonylcarbamoyladenosine biosynthesis protein TsaE (modular protein) [uncultured spirochete]|jgi:tRNA threonylcarbamoyladenosine biosynthesis protein TsaE|uniref:tRNA threonylcarbamoyladenosine biosynthesis protein TsaE n=1 Tax=uncultured spirochete TaxID=156406 RepID=A0A3P3XU00_9SPIR|nr:tRNA threonylcarbamoyladenosine biosynthesis protein TsaE (modular protein) [uncultured spirochete]
MSAKHSIKTKVQHKGGSVLIFLSSPHVHRTLAVGRAIGHAAPDGAVISFRGDIGAGKTTLAKGIAEGLGIAEPVISPTYTIISEYYGRLHLVHIDAYRLSGEDEFLQTGGEELLGAPGTLSLIEWSERIADILPPESQRITITVEANGDRLMMIEGDWIEKIDWKRFAIRREVIQ